MRAVESPKTADYGYSPGNARGGRVGEVAEGAAAAAVARRDDRVTRFLEHPALNADALAYPARKKFS